MSDFNSVDQERLAQVSRVVVSIYGSLVREAIADVKALPEKCRQSGDDSKLKDVWEEFKYQIQREQSGMFELYEEVILGICARVVANLDRERQQLLWLWSEAYYDWDDEEDVMPCDVTEPVAREVYERLCSAAENEDLLVDPDEEWDRERHEDDVADYDAGG